MKKKFATILSALMVLVVMTAGASALTLDDMKQRAAEYMPEDAVYLSMETDDGWNELKYWSESYQAMYEIYFDPASGELGKIKGESWNDNGSTSVVLNEDRARLELAELCPEAVVDFIVLDKDDGLYEYKIAFHTDLFFGVLKLNPETGDILEYERDYAAARLAAQSGIAPTFDFVSTATDTTSGETTPDEAKALVLARLENGTVLKLEEDWDDGRLVYEGEAVDAEYEYDFEIDAATGRFIEWERDRFRQMPTATAQPAEQKTTTSSSKTSSDKTSTSSKTSSDKTSSSSDLISKDKAKSIALNKAGGGKVVSIKLDRDDGRQVYEGEVHYGKYEYDFEIDAKTGKVLEWDKDRIDD